MATLRTLGWVKLNGEQVCKEFVVPLPKVMFAQEYNVEGKGDTCIITLSDTFALHIDIPLKQMRKILDEHHKSPYKNFDTHPSLE